MHLSKLIRPALAAAALLACTGAFADTKSLNVSAAVAGVCKIQTVPAMAFTLDPSAAGDTTETSTVTYKCTKNTPVPTVTLGTPGAATFSGSLAKGADTIGFSVAITTAPAGVGAGFAAADQTFVLTGTILGTAYADAPAGTYNGTVAVNIAP